MLNDEILIVISSLEKKERMDNRKMPCCFINLKDEEFLKAKKGVMVFSPYLLTLSFAYNKLYKIFHEIAHYKLNHPMVVKEDAGREYERNAKELALEWLQQELHHLNALSPSKTKQHRE